VLNYVKFVLFSYSYGGYASGESSQVGAQPVYVQQVSILGVVQCFSAVTFHALLLMYFCCNTPIFWVKQAP